MADSVSVVANQRQGSAAIWRSYTSVGPTCQAVVAVMDATRPSALPNSLHFLPLPLSHALSTLEADMAMPLPPCHSHTLVHAHRSSSTRPTPPTVVPLSSPPRPSSSWSRKASVRSHFVFPPKFTRESKFSDLLLWVP